LRLYGRIGKRAGNKRKFTRNASQTKKAGTNCIFFQKSGLARATREAREVGEATGERRGEKIFQYLLSA